MPANLHIHTHTHTHIVQMPCFDTASKTMYVVIVYLREDRITILILVFSAIILVMAEQPYVVDLTIQEVMKYLFMHSECQSTQNHTKPFVLPTNKHNFKKLVASAGKANSAHAVTKLEK